MFNPTNDFNVEYLWELLGTFYNSLDASGKALVNTYWKALFNSLESLLYDLSQVYLSNSPIYSHGYIERSFNNYVINPNNDNVSCAYLNTPVIASGGLSVTSGSNEYLYYISAVNEIGETAVSDPILAQNATTPISISFVSVPNSDSYNVYKKAGNNFYIKNINTNSFTDTGAGWISYSGIIPTVTSAVEYYNFTIPDGDYYLTIPTVSGYHYHNTLTEGVDYEIINGNTLSIKAPEFKKDRYIFNRGICALPIVFNMYLPEYLGDLDPREILINKTYKPYVSKSDDLEDSILWAKHLMKLCHAMSLRLSNGPTIKVLQEVLALYHNVPFAYEPGTVTNISTDVSGFNVVTVTNSNNETTDYKIPNSLDLCVSQGSPVGYYDLLSNDVHVYDYISNSGLIDAYITNVSGSGIYFYERESTIVCNIPSEYKNLNYDERYVDYCFESTFPPDLTIIKNII